MFYGKDAIEYRKALKALEQARVAVHYLATQVNGAYRHLEEAIDQTARTVRELQAVLDESGAATGWQTTPQQQGRGNP